MAESGLSWRDQLSRVRNVVVEQEKRREVEKRLERERNEGRLTERLKEDTPKALSHRLTELKQRFDHAARKLFPLPQIQAMSQEIIDLHDLLAFYVDCMRSFTKVFNQSHRSMFPSLLNDVKGVMKGMERQLKQWGAIKPILDNTQFRPRTSDDDAILVTIAKEFSQRAHDVPLSIPADYFSRENRDFWTIESEGKAIGYVKFWPRDEVVTFAVAQPNDINVNKFLRGLLYKFGAEGPLPKPQTAIRVKITFPREAKFFSDLGFIRTETKGPSEWIYTREL